jgi:phosphoribosyl 1,2-cyclic phosphate phosphodiesterase
VWIQTQGVSFIVDTGPDFRTQVLRESIEHLDALLFTHAHFDHIAGLDDVKPFSFKETLAVYGNEATYESLRQQYPYNFGGVPSHGSSTPSLEWNTIHPLKSFSVKGVNIMPIPLQHGNWQPLGYRIEGVAYLLDCKSIPDESLPFLKNLDLLVLTGLRPEKEHPNHMTFREALLYVDKLKPKETLFSHMEHAVDHERESALLPPNVGLSYDGLKLKIKWGEEIVQIKRAW